MSRYRTVAAGSSRMRASGCKRVRVSVKGNGQSHAVYASTWTSAGTTSFGERARTSAYGTYNGAMCERSAAVMKSSVSGLSITQRADAYQSSSSRKKSSGCSSAARSSTPTPSSGSSSSRSAESKLPTQQARSAV